MPLPRLTKGAREKGVQTFQRVRSKLPRELTGVELDYLSMRDWYMNTLSRREQYEEALKQAKADGDEDFQVELGNKLQMINSNLIDVRDRVRKAGERSWAESFLLVAGCLLPPDVMKILSCQADELLGRVRHEFKR